MNIIPALSNSYSSIEIIPTFLQPPFVTSSGQEKLLAPKIFCQCTISHQSSIEKQEDRYPTQRITSKSYTHWLKHGPHILTTSYYLPLKLMITAQNT